MSLLTALTASLVLSLPVATLAHGSHDHAETSFLPTRDIGSTSLPVEHPVYKLFKRQAAGAKYPTPDVAGPTPQAAWVTKYNAAMDAKLIPTWPVATYHAGSLPTYPATAKPDSPDPAGLCSWSSATCNATDDIINVPAGKVALSFDDGPQPPSTTLLAFLKQQSLTALHFMIGSRIVDNLAIFKQTVADGGALAVHTWSHPYMTTLTDAQVLGELGWTLQIIFDNTGRLPAFWRPPYGDVDNRVRAIAKQVFGLQTVIWNYDTRDWCLSDLTPGKSACSPGDGPQTYSQLTAELTGMYALPKTTGLVILEHEHTTRGVQGFMETFPLIAQNGWQVCALPDCLGSNWYQNAANDNDTPVALGANGVANAGAAPVVAAAAAATTAATNATVAAPSAAVPTVTGNATVADPAAAAAAASNASATGSRSKKGKSSASSTLPTGSAIAVEGVASPTASTSAAAPRLQLAGPAGIVGIVLAMMVRF